MEYGAYQIRRRAGRRYGFALKIVVGAFLILVGINVAFTLYTRYQIARGLKEAQDAFAQMRKDDLKEGYKVKFLATARLAPTRRMAPDAVKSSPEIVSGTPKEQIVGIRGPVTYNPTQGVITTPIIDTTSLKDSELPLAKQKIVPTEVMQQVPGFPGGAQAFMKWLDENITYPQSCIRQKKQGNVVVSFIVGTDGYATDYSIENAFDKQVYSLILGALKRMPRWTPATDEQGKPTPAKVTVPIEFKV